MAKSPWLQEVEDDAVRITQKRFRDQEEERQYQLAKQDDGVVQEKSEDSEDDAVEEPIAPKRPYNKKGAK